MPSNEWDWSNNNESLVVPPVQAIAVYRNAAGDIVIRQQDPYDNEDSIVILPRSSVAALIKALKAEAAKPFASE